MIIGNTCWAVPWDGWKEPPILCGLLICDASSAKNPALDAILDPVKLLDNALSVDYEAARQEWAAVAAAGIARSA